MNRNRTDKINDFNCFFNECNDFFTKLGEENNERSKFFQDYYKLQICPGGRYGRDNNKIIDIFWGNSIYDEISDEQGKKKYLFENGTSLFFFLNDTGDVTISLYPAKTENRRPIEDSIELYQWIDPIKLKRESFRKALWKDFIAYMECTSLEGRPTWYQKMRIYYLKQVRHLVVDKKWQPRKISILFNDILKWVFTVGLSGLIIYFLTPSQSSNEKYFIESNNTLKSIKNNIENNSYHLKNEELKKISNALDSINYRLKELSRNNPNKQ